MKKVIDRIQIGFLAYLVPLIVYLPIVWCVSLVIQKHQSLLNALYAYIGIAGFMLLSLLANYIIAVLDFNRPWWLKFICTLVAGILFTPVYTILAPLGAFVIASFPGSACFVTRLLASVAMVTTGIFTSSRGNLRAMRIKKAVVALNHRSSGDYFLSPYIGGYGNWRVMIGANLWRYRKFHWFFNAIGIAIEREKERTDRRAFAVRTTQDLLETSDSMKILVYIEGTRNRDDDIPLLPARRGAFKIACDTGTPIIPVVILNMQYWRRPSPQNTDTFDRTKKRKFKVNGFFKVTKNFFVTVFKEGINPTIVKIYYLDPIATTDRKPEDVEKEVTEAMSLVYMKYKR